MSIIVMELILVAVVALGIGLWQLYDVNRALRESGEHEQSSVADQERMDAGHQGDEKDDRGV